MNTQRKRVLELLNESEAVWKDVKGYEGLYIVSSKGEVASIPRGRNTGRILRKARLPSGYDQVSLCKNNVAVNRLVHRVVGEAFIPNHLSKPCVNHINGIKHDNNVTNLEWATYSENETHSYKILNKAPNRGMSGKYGFMNPFSKPVAVLNEKEDIVRVFENARIAAGVIPLTSKTNINSVCQGRRKTHAGYKFKYITRKTYYEFSTPKDT